MNSQLLEQSAPHTRSHYLSVKNFVLITLIQLSAVGCQRTTLPKAETVESPGPLVFETTSIHVDYHPRMGAPTIRYPFSVRSDAPVEIQAIRPGCGCLAVVDGMGPYKDKEQGEIVLRLQPGRSSPERDFEVEVVLDEDRSQKLHFSATIPELITLSAESLKWKVNTDDKPTAQTITISMHEPIALLSIGGNASGFDWTYKNGKLEHEFILEVTPKDLSKPTMGLLSIETDSAYPAWKRLALPLAVEP